jgi:hypothetical protein
MDTGRVEMLLGDKSMISINCTAVENEIADNRFERSELDWHSAILHHNQKKCAFEY